MIAKTAIALIQPRGLSPSAMPARNMIAPNGTASIVVTQLASSISTHEKIKQKNAVTPIPGAMAGRRIFMKKCGKE